MKLVIVFALIGLGAQIGDLQAREPAVFFEPWSSTQGDEQTTVPSRPDSDNQRPPHKHSHHNSDRRHTSLDRASEKVHRLHRQKENVIRILKRARKLHASSHQIRKIKRNLHRVSKQLHQAKRDYRYMLHAHYGKYRPQRWHAASLHHTHRRPTNPMHSSRNFRTKYK